MATNIFLQLDGIKGGSTDEKHKDWIEIFSWSHSFDQPSMPISRSGGQAATTAMCNHSPISITKILDESTYAILKTVWTGDVLPNAKIECFRAGKDPIKYLEISMEKVIISGYSIGAQGDADIPAENITLTYGKVTYNHIPYKRGGDEGGNQPVSHNLETNVVA
jgi:type VI secretion system secreted protein Hcp